MNIFLKIVILCYTIIDVKSTNLEKRIIGGQLAEPGKFTYHGTLLVDGRYRCAATLITSFHLLTTAHCLLEPMLRNSSRTKIMVLIGSHRLYHGLLRKVSRLSYHKEFTMHPPYLHPHNIGVIHLRDSVPRNGSIRIVVLPPRNFYLEPNAIVIITGFGLNSTSGPLSPRLVKIVLRTIDIHKCEISFPDRLLHSYQLCTRPGRGFGMASGDHGNPMVSNGDNYLLGIVSFGTNDFGAGGPDIYTQVWPYLNYIRAEINNRIEAGGTDGHPYVNYN